ncbi:MAG: DUF4430 domain-containing protein [Clostridia bacterium]|nr:DUF4430 domain-containing protein [Clostridia bacterium]
MKMTRLKKSLSFFLCIMLIAAIALFATGCNDSNNQETTTTPTSTEAPAVITELGQGAKSFDFTVVDSDSKETKFRISTDKKTVGEALQELKLIEGEEGPYGLYVKTVNGITLDYDKDGKYWAFYVNGEYGQTGVDATDIVEGTSYSFKAE